MFPCCVKSFVLFLMLSLPKMLVSGETFALCNGQKASLHCKEGTKIKILTASYGRANGDVCPDGNTAAQTCSYDQAEFKVKWNCNGYRTCQLHASEHLFGNPCPNVSKYLEVDYHCVKNSDGDNGDKTGKPIVAFNAYISKHLRFHRDSQTNVVYDKVVFNHGNAYDSHTGIFTAPSEGLYVFTWSSVIDPKTIFNAAIVVNGEGKGSGNCINDLGTLYENCSNTVPLVLKTGDKVNIRTLEANFLYKYWSNFKGWKVQ